MHFAGNLIMEEKKQENQPAVQTDMFKVSLILDNYNDIFSDFDPRPYNEKALSEDFLSEVRRRHMPKKKGGLEIRFILPDKERNPKTEAMVKRRLKAYFKEEYRSLSELVGSRKKRGYTYIALGTVLLILVTFLGATYPDNFWVTIGELLLTPPGWFGMWEGLGKVLERDESLSSQLELSRNLSESTCVFISETEALGEQPQEQEKPTQ